MTAGHPNENLKSCQKYIAEHKTQPDEKAVLLITSAETADISKEASNGKFTKSAAFITGERYIRMMKEIKGFLDSD